MVLDPGGVIVWVIVGLIAGWLDGLYVLGTNVAAERLSTSEVVLAYCLAHVERAFRHFKLSEL